MDALPDPTAFDPSPEEEGELRERLLRAGEIRAGGPAAAQGQEPLPVPEIEAEAPADAEGAAPAVSSASESDPAERAARDPGASEPEPDPAT
jgi:segregation and condensation protein B